MQLGFSLPLEKDANAELGHTSPRWSDWDGGKIGGRPSWLNPRDIPHDVLRCRGPCNGTSDDGLGTPLCFITQLYCPADDVNEHAFHRSLYVFACPKCCSGSSTLMQSLKNANSKDNEQSASEHSLSDCIQVLRCQLPKKNEFFSLTGDADGEWSNHKSSYWAKHEDDDKLNLCAVCGQRSKGKCPKQKKWFCCPNHQKEHLRASKKLQGDETSSVPIKYLPSVCFESELVVEEEPEPPSQHATTGKDTKQNVKSSLFDGELTDADSNLDQSDLNAMTLSEAATGVTDPTTLAFYARMTIGGEENDVRDQCLRYSRWPQQQECTADDEDDTKEGPLWITSNNQPPSGFVNDTHIFPQPCHYCGAARSFEFQILPQMLHYLFHDPDSSDEGKVKSRQVLSESESAILLEASSKIQSGVDLPPGFREQHEKAVAKARDMLLGITGNGVAKKGEIGSTDSLEWGTIAIYTCTLSCGDGDVVLPRDLKNMDVEEKGRLRSLGAYREEVAWVQPPLD